MSLSTAWDAAASNSARTTARQRLQQNRDAVSRLQKELTAALQEARTYKDPHLTSEGLSARRQQLAEAARAKYRPQIDQVRAQVDADAATIRSWADSTRPTVGEDAPSLMRAQVAWDRVRMRLEAGIPMGQIVASATRDEAVAIREWAPAWMESTAYAARGRDSAMGGQWAAPDTTSLMRSVDERLAQVEGGQVSASLAALREAETIAAGAAPMLDHLSTLTSDTAATGAVKSDLEAALASHYAAQEASAGWQDPATSDAGASEVG